MEKEIDKNQEATTEDSSIYNYFKDHPNLLIACISAVAAITTFVFNAVLYFDDYKHLQYWGFDISRIEWTRANELYIIGSMLIFYICNGTVQSFEATTFLVYRKKVKYVNATRWMLNCIASELKQRNRDHLRAKRKMKKIEKLGNKIKVGDEKRREVEDIYTRLAETEDRLKKLQEKLLPAQEAGKRLKRRLFIQLITSIVLATVISIILLLILLLAVSNITVNRWMCVLLAFAYSFIVPAFGYIISAAFYPSIKKSKLKKIMEDDEQLVSFLDEVENQDLTIQDYPIHKWRKYELKEVLSNRNIALALIDCLFCSLIIFTLFLVTADKRIEDQKVFSICQKDEITYAIIYQNKNTFYMDEAEWVDDAITIDVSKQRIITVNDISYETISFEKVFRINDRKQYE